MFCDDDVARGRRSTSPRAGSACGSRSELSVVGFDGLDIGRVLDPPLTTVAADAGELGRIAFELLRAQLAGQPAAQPRAGRRARSPGLDRTAPLSAKRAGDRCRQRLEEYPSYVVRSYV